VVDVNGMKTVVPPRILWRCGRPGGILYFSAITPAVDVLDDAGNRFDVLGAGVMYAATTRCGAYMESLQTFRPSNAARAAASAAQTGLMIVGGVPADWRTTHAMGEFTLDHPLPFLDLEHPTTRRALEHELAGDLAALGVKNLDIPDVRSEHRRVTRTIATWAYLAHGAASGDLAYSGIRYVSKLDDQECWAIFDQVVPLLIRERPSQTIQISRLRATTWTSPPTGADSSASMAGPGHALLSETRSPDDAPPDAVSWATL